MVVVIDNYDSFTYNLVQYLGELGAEIAVYRNDAVDVETVRALDADHIVISPVITPAPGGAKAMSTLLTITNKTTKQGDIVHWEGGYEDTFEKTPNGWRFKSRVHVWPEIQWTDNPADMPPRDLEKE